MSNDFKDEQPSNISIIAEPTAREVLKFERSRLSRAEQPLNMDSKQATFFVSKDERFTDFKRLQFQNISRMLRTFEVLNDERSRDARDEQPWNIFDIFVTFDVSKLDKSSVSKDSQPLNTELISVTDEVSNEDRSTAWSEAQPENMEDIEGLYLSSARLLVSKHERSRLASEEQPENMDDIFVTAEVSKPDKSIDSANGRFANNCEADPEIITPGST